MSSIQQGEATCIGVEIFLASRFSVRPHFRGTFSGEAGLAQFLVTAGYRW